MSISIKFWFDVSVAFSGHTSLFSTYSGEVIRTMQPLVPVSDEIEIILYSSKF